jgi:IS30 family transposase
MYEDRCQIYALSKRGASQKSIAEVLGVSQSVVSREMCRNRGQRGYRFKQAEAKAQARQAIRSKPRKPTAPLRREGRASLNVISVRRRVPTLNHRPSIARCPCCAHPRQGRLAHNA